MTEKECYLITYPVFCVSLGKKKRLWVPTEQNLLSATQEFGDKKENKSAL